MNIIPYFWVFFLITYFFLSSNKNECKSRKIFACLYTIVCILLTGLRNVAVGSDTYAYFLHFEEVRQMSWPLVLRSFTDYIYGGGGKDLGYLLLQKSFQLLCNNFQIFMIFVVLIFYIPIVKLIYQRTITLRGLFLALMLLSSLFFQFTYTGLRQVLVFGISAMAFHFIEEKKLIKYVLVILVAATLHKTVLLLLPCYFVSYAKRSGYVYAVSLLALPLLFLFRELLALYMVMVSGEERYMMYADGTFNNAGTPVFTALILLIMITGIIYQKKIKSKNTDTYIITNFVVIAVILTPLTWVDPNMMRLVMYFTLFLPIYFARLIDAMPSRISSLAMFTSVVGMAMLMLKQAVPYAFFWQKMNLGDNYF